MAGDMVDTWFGDTMSRSTPIEIRLSIWAVVGGNDAQRHVVVAVVGGFNLGDEFVAPDVATALRHPNDKPWLGTVTSCQDKCNSQEYAKNPQLIQS